MTHKRGSGPGRQITADKDNKIMPRELYVGNIDFEATEEDLRRLFTVAGTVTAIHLITDPVSGQFKGCGYVKMSSDSEAKEAINSLDGALLLSRLLTVSIARPQKPGLSKNPSPGRNSRPPGRSGGSTGPGGSSKGRRR
jgi:RNA recognition motif-containing protein